MVLTETMSVLGLYQWDNTIFDRLVVPDGVDKDVIIQTILLETANREVLYPDPVIMKNAIGLWSARSINTWNKLYNTTILEYDPISNYDRKETWTDTTIKTSTENVDTTNNVTQTADGSVTENNTHSDTDTGTVDVVRSIAAYNDATLSDAEKTAENRDLKKSTTENNKSTTTASGTVSDTRKINTTAADTVTNTREGRAYGNIGVTTTQKMILAEREVAMFNIYDYITKSFCDKFVLGVW